MSLSSLDAPNILIVEDTAAVAQVLVDLFQDDLGCDATAVADGTQALQVLRDSAVDLLVLDLMLPGFDGLELYDRLQQAGNAGDARVLFLTANAAGAERIRARGLPVLRKPFEIDDLLQEVATLLDGTA